MDVLFRNLQQLFINQVMVNLTVMYKTASDVRKIFGLWLYENKLKDYKLTQIQFDKLLSEFQFIDHCNTN